jgi:hypothetical protein
MGLTSPILVAVLAVAATCLLTGVIWLWPRLAGRSLRAVLARLAYLGGLELIVLGLIFVVVNRSADFYSSWSDLFGAGTGRAAIVAAQQRGAGVASMPPLTVRRTRVVPVSGRHSKARAARLQTVRLHGALSGLTVTGYVLLPARYSAASAARPLPVAVVLSDRLAGGAAGPDAEQFAAMATAQMAAGRLRPLIIVMLPARIGGAQGCLNIPGAAQAATWFSEDLPHVIDSAYHAAGPVSGDWALLAGSSGGYCALQLALNDAQTFSAAALPAAGYQAPPGPAGPGSARLRLQDNLQWLARHRPMQRVSVLFAGAARPWAALARPPMRVFSAGPAAGAWPSAAATDWIGRQLGPAAAAS